MKEQKTYKNIANSRKHLEKCGEWRKYKTKIKGRRAQEYLSWYKIRLITGNVYHVRDIWWITIKSIKGKIIQFIKKTVLQPLIELIITYFD